MLEALVYQLDGQNKFEFHREWRWKGLLTMDIVGENMAKKTFLEPHTQGIQFNANKPIEMLGVVVNLTKSWWYAVILSNSP
jgi:hypothetical protein